MTHFRYDGREDRCPLTFVKFKQHLNQLSPGDNLDVLLSDETTKNDIIRYLTDKPFELHITKLSSEWIRISIDYLYDTD